MEQEMIRDQFALIRVEGMHCHKCELAIKKSLQGHIGVHEVEVDFASGQASVIYNPRIVSIPQLMDAVKTAGYAATGFTKGQAGETV